MPRHHAYCAFLGKSRRGFPGPEFAERHHLDHGRHRGLRRGPVRGEPCLAGEGHHPEAVRDRHRAGGRHQIQPEVRGQLLRRRHARDVRPRAEGGDRSGAEQHHHTIAAAHRRQQAHRDRRPGHLLRPAHRRGPLRLCAYHEPARRAGHAEHRPRLHLPHRSAHGAAEREGERHH